MDDLLHDLKSATRSLSRRPAFALMVIATLGIGLGASAAMFSVVNGVLLEPLPFEDPDRLVTLIRQFSNDPAREEYRMSLPDLRDVQAESESLEAAAGYRASQKTLLADGEPRLVSACSSSDGLLQIFGLEPHLGRDLRASDAEPGAEKVVVLGHGFWQSHFGGDPEVLGEPLVLSGAAHTVIGVAPRGYGFPQEAELWTSWQLDTEDCGRACHILRTVGRLAAGTSPRAATEELGLLSAGLEARYPDSNAYKRIAVRRLQEQQVASVQSALWMLLGAVQLVVLIAAVNVANLVLVRGRKRRRELAIRAAVGAGRWRLFRQLMCENALLAFFGAVVGLAIGKAVLEAFLRLAPLGLPRMEAVGLDATVLAFTAGLAFVMLLAFGLVPALRLARPELHDRGTAGERQGTRSRRALLTAEVALALLLLLGAGLLLRSFVQMTEIDLGFRPERVTRVAVALPEAAYAEPELIVAFSERLESALGETPGIEAAGMAFAGPFGDNRITSRIEPEDRPEPAPGHGLSARFDVVSPGFFEALQIRPLRGRVFTEHDTREAPLALVISQTLAERYYPGKDPIGERADIGVGFNFDDSDAIYTIIGVIPDIRAYSLTDEPMPAVYMAQAQTASDYLSVLVRSRAGIDAEALVRQRLRELDPELPVRAVETQVAAIDEAFGPHRFYLALLASFAAIALLLSAVGLYGVVAYAVSQRARELAVRMVLGADGARVLRLVLADALLPASAGIALGLLGALAGSRVLASFLYGVTPHDPVTFLAAPALLLAVALLAAVSPALRAARLEPRSALEAD
ncbi:MAG: ABC transporter permease [Holophagales bacterium]|nr:ABC transporter permease [Holophagales bacterium]